jgi:TRAP transporter 4TM/12TM fusion protein
MQQQESGNGAWSRISRYLSPLYLMYFVAFSMATYHLYKAYFGVYEIWRHRGIHLVFLLLLAFFNSGLCVENRSKVMKAWDVVLILVTLAIGGYVVIDYEAIGLRAGIPDTLDKIACVVLAFLVVISVRRTLGWPMTIVTVLFALYVIFGQHLPFSFVHGGYSFRRLVDIGFNSTDGILGLPTGVSAVYVAIFVYFGTFLLKSGAADYFKDLSFALAGSRVGGPAKVAVIGSAMVGTMMGNGIANIVTTGSFTIPMMKKLGYQPHFAGAVEAVASMGGQIMPPIMASVVFLIAEYTGEPLYKLMIWAFVPALMYFLCLFWGVHFEALKRNLGTTPKEELPDFKTVLTKGPWYLLLPLPTLVILLFVGYSPFYSAFLAIIAILICASFHPKSRMGPRKIVEAMIEGSLACVVMGLACAAASIIVASIEVTGLGLSFSSLMIALAGNHLLLLLLLAMVASIVLGMGMTTVAAYIIVATLTIPALVKMGVNEIAAHMFCFYFAILSGITPPVAIGAFVAAGIAKANELRTAITAMKLGLVGLIVPYLFVYDNSFLLMGTLWETLARFVLATIGVYAMSAAINGYLFSVLPVLPRIVILASAAALLWPQLWEVNIIGLFVFGACYGALNMTKRRAVQTPAPGVG